MKKIIRVYKWQIEIKITAGRFEEAKRKIRVQPVIHKTVAEKFDYAMKLYNTMWYNPVFKDVQHVLEALRDAAVELGNECLNDSGRALSKFRIRSKEKALDMIIHDLHCFVESIADKDEAFIRSVGMKPMNNA